MPSLSTHWTNKQSAYSLISGSVTEDLAMESNLDWIKQDNFTIIQTDTEKETVMKILNYKWEIFILGTK